MPSSQELLLLAASSTSLLELVLWVATTLAVALVIFERVAWRWPPFRWLVQRPDLRGTWAGTLKSDFAGSTHREVFLVVHQTFSKLTLRLQTEESQSMSTTARLVVEPDEPVSLLYLYHSEPRLEHQGRSRTHWGAVRLMLVGPDSKMLTGEYWTDRKTAGSLDLRLISRTKATGWLHAAELAGATRGEDPRNATQPQPTRKMAPSPVRPPHGLVDILAKLFHDAEAAKTLAVRARFPSEHLPDFKTPIAFWTAVVQQAENGMSDVGLLIEEALRQFSGNSELNKLARERGRSPSFESPPQSHAAPPAPP